MISALPASLGFICHNGAGYDQVVVPAATKRGIRVSHTPTAVDDATADIGIFLMLGALRNLAASMASLRAGEWRGKTLPALGHDPEGKVLGILGMGGIGRNMARKAAVFGMRVRYFNRTRLDEEVEREVGAKYVDFDTLVAESDVLSLNLPLNVSSLRSDSWVRKRGTLTTGDIGAHKTHHLEAAVRQDEGWCGHRQHRTGSCHG